MCVCARSVVSDCDYMDCNTPGSSFHGNFHGKFIARILEWVAMPSSGGSPNPGIELTSPESFALARRFFTTEPLGKPLLFPTCKVKELI